MRLSKKYLPQKGKYIKVCPEKKVFKVPQLLKYWKYFQIFHPIGCCSEKAKCCVKIRKKTTMKECRW